VTRHPIVITRRALDALEAVASVTETAEDGGSLCGFHVERDGEIAVVLTDFISAGPNAIRKPEWFEPDVEHLNREVVLLHEETGARFQGNAHVHFEDPAPSTVDLEAGMAARRAGYDVFAQLIWSHVPGDEGARGFLLRPEALHYEPAALVVLEVDGSTHTVAPALAPRPGRVVALDVVAGEIERLRGNGVTTGLLYGRILPLEGLTQVFSARPCESLPGDVVGAWGTEAIALEPGAVFYDVAKSSWLAGTPIGTSPVEPEIANTSREALGARAQGRADLGVTAKKHVVLVACGSLGSELAIDLASVVGRVTLVEQAGAHLSVENLCRHALDLADVGRSKALALGEKLLRVNPNLRVTVREFDAADDPEKALSLLEDADLVVVSTDKVTRQVLWADLAREAKTPAVFPWAYEYADGGEVFAQLEDGPSYREVFAERAATGHEPLSHRAFAYAEVESPDELRGSPGLRTDLRPIVATAAAVAFALLDPADASRAPLVSRERPLVLLHSGRIPGRLAHMFERAFERIHVRFGEAPQSPVSAFFPKIAQTSFHSGDPAHSSSNESSSTCQ
jgi:hypothetical protein